MVVMSVQKQLRRLNLKKIPNPNFKAGFGILNNEIFF
jgi:hypothetical protein